MRITPLNRNMNYFCHLRRHKKWLVVFHIQIPSRPRIENKNDTMKVPLCFVEFK